MLNPRKVNVSLVLLLVVLFVSVCQCQWGSPSENVEVEEDNNKTENTHNNRRKVPDGPMTPLPYALSSTYLTYLARTEVELYNDMKNYAKILRERLQLADNYLKDYEDSTVKGTEHLGPDADLWKKASQVSSNPIMSYRMVRRFVNEFDNFGAHVNQRMEESKYLQKMLSPSSLYTNLHFGILNLAEMVDRVNKLGGQYGFPGDKDQNDAIDALLRLHYVYDLKAEDVS
jgi:hypothetical protein